MRCGNQSMNEFSLMFRIVTKFVCIVLILFISACNGVSNIDKVITMASDNRCELENALNAVGNDTMKRAAMEYLIVNSPYHSSTLSTDLDTLKRRLTQSKMSDKELSLWRTKDLQSGKSDSDVRLLSFDILVDNVNLAVDTWRSRPWAKHYSFEDFCEYVLPYRIGDEPLENWRQSYLDRYSAVYDSLCRDMKDPVEAAHKMLTYVREQRVRTLPELSYPNLGALYLLENRLGYCRDHCDLAIYVLRALGIPVATDFYRESPSYNSRHFWTAVIDTLHRVREFNLGESPATWENPVQRKKGKVYRQTFSPQITTHDKTGIDPFFTNRFIKDVSEEYGFNDSIIINSTHGEDALYLSVYSHGEYKAIVMAKTVNGAATFRNLESDILYFPTAYISRKQQAISYPISTGPANHIYNYSDDQTEDAEIIRKYPYQKSRLFLGNTVGMKIKFLDCNNSTVHTHEITDTPDINIIHIDMPKGKTFQSVRIEANPLRRLEMGEVWTGNLNNHISPQSVIAFTENDNTQDTITSKVTDEKWETCYVSPKNGASAKIKFDKPAHNLYLIPRTDDNYVHPGDTYELLYHAGSDGWKSLGRKTAESSSIRYKVPVNTVLWLKNHTRGREERPFYMNNGNQIFP